MTRFFSVSSWLIGLAIFAVAGFLMLGAAIGDSPTVDEPGHIASGYSKLRYLDYRLNIEHPPLGNVLVALPLLFRDLNFPVSSPFWQEGVNRIWDIGPEFLYGSGNNPEGIMLPVRLAVIVITILLGALIYWWSGKFLGSWWALMPSTLFMLSPLVLAHGHYATTDVIAVLGTFLAIIAFPGFLKNPSKLNFILAGVAFGLAQAIKFSSVFLIPYFIGLACLLYFLQFLKEGRNVREQKLELLRGLAVVIAKTFLVFMIGYALVFVVYLVFSWNYPVDKQLSDTRAILEFYNFSGISGPIIWLSGMPVVRHFMTYVVGLLMVAGKADFHNVGYFMGEVQSAGWLNYFPAVFVFKESIISLIFVLSAFALLVALFFKFIRTASKDRKFNYSYMLENFTTISVLIFVVFFWALIIRSRFNIGLRHILPSLPFIYILTAQGIKFLVGSMAGRQKLIRRVVYLILVVLLAWYGLNSYFQRPYFLSYFNALGGGTENGYKIVTDSNYDWGQDFKRFRDWVETNLDKDEKIAVKYFGPNATQYYLGEQGVNWSLGRGNPYSAAGIRWLAVSVNSLQIYRYIGSDNPEKDADYDRMYGWLADLGEPYARAGTSIFIYKLND